MLPEWTAVGFSGHRKLENPAGVVEGIRKTLARLEGEHGPLVTISSAASGADTLFLEEVARKKLPFRIVLPFERKIFERDFDPQDWQRVLPLLDEALFIQEISATGSRKEAFLETGVLIVEASDIMILVWDGKSAAGTGGTGDVVNYARALVKPLIIIDAALVMWSAKRGWRSYLRATPKPVGTKIPVPPFRSGGMSFFPRMILSGYEKLSRSLQIAWCLDRNASCSSEETRDGYLVKRVGSHDDLRKRLEATHGWAGLFRLVTKTEDCLLKEVAEWYSFVRFTGVLIRNPAS